MGKVKRKIKRGSEQLLSNKSEQKALLNPFEIHLNRKKCNVLGRKPKHDRGLPGVARTKAIEKRKNTLLQEYYLKDKSNKFLDRRIGEKNKKMTVEEKIMARFTAERMKIHNKKSVFNLADDEVLTHHGQSLNEVEKFDIPESDDDAEDEGRGKLGAEFVEDAHFGGGVLTKADESTKVSRKDLIEQLIAESKKRKMEQQRAREQTIELTEKLDTEWRDLLPLVSASKKTENDNTDVNEKPDAYDTVVRELKFEARGKPCDRLKSEEELAQEEKVRLEQLEADRLRRMHGTVEQIKNINHRSADDLDDGFRIESDKEVEEPHEQQQENDSEDSDEAVKEEEQEDDDDDDDGVDEEDNLSDLKNVSNTEDEQIGEDDDVPICREAINIKEDLLTRKAVMDAARKELPYTFQVPEMVEDLQKVLEFQSPDHQAVILERMIKCNHPSLAEGNKEKLTNLFAFLMQHLQDSAVESEFINRIQEVLKSTYIAAKVLTCGMILEENGANSCFKVLDRLSPYLYDLAHICPESAAHCVIEVMKEKQVKMKKNRHTFPRLDMLVFLKLISLLFPTSDFRHPVVTPVFVFIEQVLDQCRIRHLRDIAVGLYLVTTMLEYTVLSKRFSPVTINFLNGVLNLAVPKPAVQMVFTVFPIHVVGKARNLLVLGSSQSWNRAGDKLKMTLDDLRQFSDEDDNFRIRALYTTMKLVLEFCVQFASLPNSYHIFKPVCNTLRQIRLDRYPKAIQDIADKVLAAVEDLEKQRLIYLVLEKKKPKALRLYEPRIEAVIDGKKRKSVSREQQEREKLLHKYKSELKGAVREIRRDRAFLANLKLKQTLQSDAERKQKVKEIFGSAALQQGELRKLKRRK